MFGLYRRPQMTGQAREEEEEVRIIGIISELAWRSL